MARSAKVAHERPILFSATQVRAILDGRKTQTRRVLSPSSSYFDGRGWTKEARAQTWAWDRAWVDPGPSPAGNVGPYLHVPWAGGDGDRWGDTVHRVYPRHQVGQRLWVRETWADCMKYGWTIADARSWMHPTEVLYRADGHTAIDGWWPSIHMPRKFSRLVLEVTSVRLERLQDISEEDARAEGASLGMIYERESPSFRAGFHDIWISIHGPGSWDANPWVTAITFRRIDQAGGQHG